MACHLAIRPGSTMAWAPVFHTTNVIMLDLQNRCFEERLSTVPFYPLLVSFRLQIKIGVDKFITSCKLYCVTQSQPPV